MILISLILINLNLTPPIKNPLLRLWNVQRFRHQLRRRKEEEDLRGVGKLCQSQVEAVAFGKWAMGFGERAVAS